MHEYIQDPPRLLTALQWIQRSALLLFLGSIVLFSLLPFHTVAAASSGYTAGVKAGDWWTLGNFQGSCQAPCPPGFQSTLDLSEATALVIGQPNATSLIIKNTLAFSNDTIRTYATTGDLSSGTGNLSFVSSILIAGGLVQGNPIFKTVGAPAINATTVAAYAGANRTINILNDIKTQRTFQWDRTTGVLVSFLLNQTSTRLSYQLTGTNLWQYRIAIVDAACQPGVFVSCGYNPLQTTIIAGTTISFNNTGTSAQTVNSCTPPYSQACNFPDYPSSAPSFASPTILPGKIWNLTISVPGEYYYYDSLDTSRKGVITVLGNATTPPDFRVYANPDPVMIPQGMYVAETLSAIASNGFTGSVSWGSSFPTGPNYPYITSSLGGGAADFYGGCCGAGVSFGVYTSFDTPQGTYTATLTGSGNGLTRSVILTIIVGPPGPSFYLTVATGTTIDMVAGQSTSVTIGVHSVAGYSGPVDLVSRSFATGPISFSINPGTVTLPPNGIAYATLTINGDAPGNSTILVSPNNGNLTITNMIPVNVDVHPARGLLLYKLYYYGTLYPGSSLLLVNSFANIGNVPDQVLNGMIVIDFGTSHFTLTPVMILQPGQTATYNITITIPGDAQLGNHPVTATITWMAKFGIFWNQAPPLVVQGQLSVRAAPPAVPPPVPPAVPPLASSMIKTLTNLAGFVRSYWLWAVAIYVPLVTALSCIFVIHEQRRSRRRSQPSSP